MRNIAKSWARYVSSKSASPLWFYVFLLNGLLWLALHFLMFQNIHHLLTLGVVFLLLAFNAFERTGFTLLLQTERKRS